RAELQSYALPNGNPLKEGRVDVEQAWAAECTSSDVSVGAGSRHQEGTGIEPAVHRPQDHRPLEVGIQVRYVDERSVTVAGIIEAGQRRGRKSALSGKDPIPLPASNNTVHPPGGAAAKPLPAPERQLIAEVRV